MSLLLPTAPARLLALPAALLAAVGLAACGTGVSTSGFTGEQKAVAQRISDFKTDATGAEEQKVCHNDLAAALRAKLGAAPGGCQAALKSQLGQLDTLELTISSIHLSGNRASAPVKSTWSGKTAASTLLLVKEAGSWRISGMQ